MSEPFHPVVRHGLRHDRLLVLPAATPPARSRIEKRERAAW